MRRKTALQFIYILHIYKNMNYDRNGSFNSVVESFLSDLMMLLLLLMLHWWSSVILFSSVQRATMSLARCSKDILMYINLLCQISALRHCTHMWISSESTGERCCDCMQTATVTTCVIVFSSSGEALQAHTHTHTHTSISLPNSAHLPFDLHVCALVVEPDRSASAHQMAIFNTHEHFVCCSMQNAIRKVERNKQRKKKNYDQTLRIRIVFVYLSGHGRCKPNTMCWGEI